MAWLHPNLYRRVISYSGTFVALQRNATAPNGAWDFHQTFIPQSERKPLRIWLHVSENDLGANSPAEQMRNLVIANKSAGIIHGAWIIILYSFTLGLVPIGGSERRNRKWSAIVICQTLAPEDDAGLKHGIHLGGIFR